MRNWRQSTGSILLPSGALLCCFLLHPLVQFTSYVPLALAIIAECCLVNAVGKFTRYTWLAWPGILGLWVVVGWCVFSQPERLDQSQTTVLITRGLLLLGAVSSWGALYFTKTWERRTGLALVLPTLLALVISELASPPGPLTFRPFWLAVDSHGMLYATETETSVIRLFAADGRLVAKLRPDLALLYGTAGQGLFPPGFSSDTEHLGVPHLLGPGGNFFHKQAIPLRDEVRPCGLALDSQDRLYLVDETSRQLLRFSSQGYLQMKVPLPPGYEPALGCIAADATDLYLGDVRGQILTLDQQGQISGSWPVSGTLHGLSATRQGQVYALVNKSIYHFARGRGEIGHWELPAVQGPLDQPYEEVVALPDGEVIVTDLATQQLLRYSSNGKFLISLGGSGDEPGQFKTPSGLATDWQGQIYVADQDHRAIQRLNSAGRVTGLWTAANDDVSD